MTRGMWKQTITMMRNDGRVNGGREVKKRWSLICGLRFWMVLLLIAVILLGPSGGKNFSNKMGILTTRSNFTNGEMVCNAPECYQLAKYVNDSINHTVDPCDDFYSYACGGWIENHPIPMGDSLFHVRSEMEDKIEFTKRKILEAGIVDINGLSRDVIKIPYDLYHSCVSMNAVNNVDDAALRKLIQELGNWTMVEENGDWNESNWDFAQVLAAIHQGYSSFRGPLFSVRVIRNPHNTSTYAIKINQEGTGLSWKEAYLDNKTMNWYKSVLVKFATLMGGNVNISEKVQDIVDLETKLANISAAQQYKRPQEMTIKELQDEAPNFPWLNHLNSIFAPERLNENETIHVGSLSYLKKFMSVILQTPKSVLANYLVSKVFWEQKDLLPWRYGFGDRKARLKSCLKLTSVELTKEIFSALYIYNNFTKHVKIKEKVTVMAAEIHESFKENVKSLSWMDNITRNTIIEKDDFMGDSLIFPDYYLNGTQLAKTLEAYNDIVTRNDTYHSNAIAIRKANHRSYLKNLRRTVHRDGRIGRDIVPASFEAFYYLKDNKIVIPAGLTQPPVYRESDNDYLRSINMGSLGFYIGHEIAHGFGRHGSRYDKYGSQTSNWWTKPSMTSLMGKIGCIMRQYSQYKIYGTIPINFKRTIDEDIADNGGLKAALKAYYDWSKKNINETWRLPGLNLTNEQLFFLGFGQNMCANIKREKRLEILQDEVHSDLQYRINGPLANSIDFANAFKCRQNSPMNPAHKCTLWSNEGSMA